MRQTRKRFRTLPYTACDEAPNIGLRAIVTRITERARRHCCTDDDGTQRSRQVLTLTRKLGSSSNISAQPCGLWWYAFFSKTPEEFEPIKEVLHTPHEVVQRARRIPDLKIGFDCKTPTALH